MARGTTRPTTDRTREAIASSILASRGLDLSESRVLDAFAGSGAWVLSFFLEERYTLPLLIKIERRVIALSVRLKSLGVATSEMSVICGDTVRLAESSQLLELLLTWYFWTRLMPLRLK